MEGSIEAAAKNVLIYATSNRRHLLPQKMRDNHDRVVIDGEIHQSDTTEEKMSLSDRFGLTLAFYAVDQESYLKMVDSYMQDFQGDRESLHKEAISYATQKGVRSGRVAKQFSRHFQTT